MAVRHRHRTESRRRKHLSHTFFRRCGGRPRWSAARRTAGLETTHGDAAHLVQIGSLACRLARTQKAAPAGQSAAVGRHTAALDPGALGEQVWPHLYVQHGFQTGGGHCGARSHSGSVAPQTGNVSTPELHRHRPQGDGSQWRVWRRRHGLAQAAARGHAGAQCRTLAPLLSDADHDGDVLQHHLEHVLPMVNRRVNAPFPYWHFVKLPADRALDRALAGIRQAVADFIEQSRARLAQDSTLAAHPTNFLEAMLAARNEDGEAFTEEEIMGNALTMLVAGEDTTANSMAWMIYFLTQYPAVHGPMHMEVDTVLGHARILQHFHDHERLTYLDAVARETMRLKPVAPMIFLETNQSVELGGIRMPQGTALFLLTRQCGLQENAFTAAGQF